MKTDNRSGDSWVSLTTDLLSAKVLVWFASVGRDAELTPEAHMFFFDRYRRLAEYHRAHGRLAKARRFVARADAHYRAIGDDGPPYAAAMAMPRPARFIRTSAVSRTGMSGPDDAA